MKNNPARQITKMIEEWTPLEASVAVAGENNYLDYQAGIHDIQIHPGQPIPSGSISERVFYDNRRVETIVDASVFGTPYYGIGYPVQDQGGFKGVLTVILPPEYSLKKSSPITFLTGKQGETWSPIPVEQITYIESNQKKTWFYTESGEYSTIYTLKTLEQRLPESFIRIHRSYIVNIPFIQQISRDISSNLLLTVKQQDTGVLTVSQKYIQRVRRILGF